jgi:hypothetical protein
MRTLTITLISIIGPFIIYGILSDISDHHQIKKNRERNIVMEESMKGMVTNEMMLVYLREQQKLMTALSAHKAYDEAEFRAINARIDQLLRDMIQHNTRSKKDTVQ